MWAMGLACIPGKNSMNAQASSDTVFVDTNIFVYAYTDDNADKHNASYVLLYEKLNHADITVSAQVLSEFYSGMRKNKKTHTEITAAMYEIIGSVNVVGLSLPTIESCLFLKEKYRYSWWDSLILASALEAGCTAVYSEDMQDGQLIEDRLTIKNPF
jgi:predicted nucleic acid-binding protein